MLVRKLCHYRGMLGEFDYYNDEFSIIRRMDAGIWKDTLHYRGHEIEGNRIHIPGGVKSLGFTFENSALRTPPVVPHSVTDMSYAFKGCVSLTTGARMPDSVVRAAGAYQGCVKLERCGRISKNLVQASYLFDGCVSLEDAPRLPEGLKSAAGIFRGCRNMRVFSELPLSVDLDRASGAYRGCDLLNEALS